MKIVNHHTKYLEIQGVDERVKISVSEHIKLHRRLRREGKCNIPAEELRKISISARLRAQKEAREKHIKYVSNVDKIKRRLDRYMLDIYG